MKSRNHHSDISLANRVFHAIRDEKRFRSRIAKMIYIFVIIFATITAMVISIG